MLELIVGIVLCAVALILGAFVFLVSAAPKAGTERHSLNIRMRALTAADAALKSRSWYVTLAETLELAGIRTSAAGVVLVVTLLAGAAVIGGSTVALARGGLVVWLLPVVLVALVILGVRAVISQRLGTRRAAFAEQLDDTLQLVASGMRAGHSLSAAFDTVALEAESPTSEEFARVLNKHRIGLDLGTALEECAVRMHSDDLAWTAQAVAIHREVGGNLSEVLDHVGETIRERNQIRRQVATLSAEGRMSANVLIALPIGVAAVLLVVSPDYLSVFATSPLGWALIGASLLLFAVGVLWLRTVVKIRF